MASGTAKAHEYAEKLWNAPPVPGYKGCVPHLKSGPILGETFNQSFLTARDMRANPHKTGAYTASWTTPRSMRAVSRMVLQGNDIRMDMQEFHSPRERREFTDELFARRSKVQSLTASRLQRKPDFQGAEHTVTFLPPEEPPIDKVNMRPAGPPSESKKLDVKRSIEHRSYVRHCRMENDKYNAYLR